MASVFNKIADIKNNVKRNSFDWSHDNNFTTDIGRITPVFTELVPPNSSVRIKPEFALRFMPMMFPIQTKMKAYLSFFKVPLRTLWKDYKDFISSDNTEDFVPPYMSFDSADYLKDGCLGKSGLGDYFGIPVTGQAQIEPLPVPSSGFAIGPLNYDDSQAVGVQIVDDSSFNVVNLNNGDLGSATTSAGVCVVPSVNKWVGSCVVGGLTVVSTTAIDSSTGNLKGTYVVTMPATRSATIRNAFKKCAYFTVISTSDVAKTDIMARRTYSQPQVKMVTNSDGSVTASFSFNIPVNIRNVSSTSGVKMAIVSNVYFLLPAFDEYFQVASNKQRIYYNVDLDAMTDLQFVPVASTVNPYYGPQSPNAVKVSAYPFRAYESIYNAYIRNTRNNPFVLNGKKTYNRWITTDDGGVDTLTPRDLRFANWASDAYTTALQAPQQGTAPLVGLTTYETQSLNDVGHLVTTINTAIVDEDGNAYKVDFESNGEALKGVNYTPLKAGEAVNLQSLVSPVTSGISINDFRNVNAYQRYLELNQFRGFSYKEIIEGRFDVNVRYDALDMPEYLGGMTRDVIINPITQTVETNQSGTYAGALGSQAGFGIVDGSNGQTISVFCDEESIIMGLMYIVPMPVYDSVLPKWLSYRDRLDSFNPEFDHIGYQPIYLEELSPVQAALSGTLQKTVFGYQRPWYEYCQKVDRAHGEFLGTLRNFIMFRSFDGVPELGADFTTVKPGQVNNVFTVTEVSDKILGQIHFDCTAQLPISRVVVPRLE